MGVFCLEENLACYTDRLPWTRDIGLFSFGDLFLFVFDTPLDAKVDRLRRINQFRV